VNALTARLIVLLRIAYITGLSLFVIDVLLAVGLRTMQWLLGADPDEATPLDDPMNWIAVIAFGFVVVGAVITIVTTSEFARNGVDVDADTNGH
jgi:hypothetical protein